MPLIADPVGPLPSGPLSHVLVNPHGALVQVAHRLAAALRTFLHPVSLAGLAVVAVGAAAVLVHRGRAQRALAHGARQVRVLPPPLVDPHGAEVLWTNLVALLRPGWRRALGAQPHLAFEIKASSDGLAFGLWVPGGVPPGLVERAVEAAWPGARTVTTEVVATLAASATVTGGELRLARPEAYPLATDHAVDPLRPLLGALSGLEEDTEVLVQVVARPTTGRRVVKLRRAAQRRRNGLADRRVGGVLDLLLPGSPSSPSVDPMRTGDVAAMVEKASSPCWAITVRYVVAGRERGPEVTARLRGRAHAVASSFALFGGHNRLDRRHLHRPEQAVDRRRLGRGDLVSVGELAALCHLPADEVVAGLERAGAKSVAPPPALAAEGRTGKILGDAETGRRGPVVLAPRDARYHVHVIGATGSGKSTLFTNLILGDIEAHRGVVVIDPKGDLIGDVCARLPAGAEERLVLIDPDEREAPPTLDVLAGGDPDLAVDNLVGIFRSIFSAFWGPRTDDVLRASCLTLLRQGASDRPPSLADVPRLLSDDRFRQRMTADLRGDPVGLGGFWRWYEGMGEASRAQVIGPVMNKLRAFLLRDFVRQVVGRRTASFDMADVLDGGICLVRVPKGELGEETSKLLGSFVVAKVWQAATNRARLPQEERRDCAIYVDECQNFLHLPRSFDEMLAEARGYGLSMVLAHQHLAQLPRDLRDAVSANARSKVFFSASPEDARQLARHVGPEVSEHDLAHLGAYQAAVRLVVDGGEVPACTVRTRPAPPASGARLDVVRRAARAHGLSVGTSDGPALAEVPGRRHRREGGMSGGTSGGTSGGSLSDARPRPSVSPGEGRARGHLVTADSWGSEGK